MQRLKSKKSGFTIIEVICALSIFTLMFMTAVSIRLSTIKMKVYNDSMEKYTEFVSEVRNEVLSNTSNEEISLMLEEGDVYIDKDSINNEVIKRSKITEIISNIVPEKKPYMKISLLDGNLVEVNLNMYTNISGREESINCRFYKSHDTK